MKINDVWVYRNLYGCDYLMSIKTNEILCISPLVAALFRNTPLLDVQQWSLENNISQQDESYLINFLEKKGVIINE